MLVVTPGDIAILFRSRDSHREFEKELQAAGVPFYVYKGLGFFDADEVKDVIALIGFLGAPGDDRLVLDGAVGLVFAPDVGLVADGLDLAV